MLCVLAVIVNLVNADVNLLLHLIDVESAEGEVADAATLGEIFCFGKKYPVYRGSFT